jgi:shikimate kinase
MPKNIILIGFMGAGKTTLGKFIADRMGFRFIDLDTEIERQEGISVAEIFQNRGEAFFRKVEGDLLRSLICEENVVIAPGAGAVSGLLRMKEVRKYSWVVYLKWTFAELWPILQTLTNRPLLTKLNQGELEQLFSERCLLYFRLANQEIPGNWPPEKALGIISEQFKSRLFSDRVG